MKLHNRKFERAAARLIVHRLRSAKDKDELREFRRHSRRLVERFWLVAGFVAMAGAVRFGVVAGLEADQRYVLFLLALYCTCTVALRSSSLWTKLYASHELSVFMHLPVPDDDFFRHQLRQTLRGGIYVVVLALIAYFGAFPSARANSATWPVVAGAAICQALLILTAALALYVWRPLNRFASYSGLGMLFGFISILIPLRFIEPFLGLANFVPAGWLSLLLSASLRSPAYSFAFVALPAGFVFLIWKLVVRIGAAFSTNEIELTIPQDEDDAAFAAQSAEPPASESMDTSDLAEWRLARDQFTAGRSEAAVRSGVFLLPVDWQSAGWIEDLAGRWYNTRERVVAAFLLGEEPPSWTKQWIRAFQAMCAGLLISVLAPILPAWVQPFAPISVTVLALPFQAGAWPAFEARWTGSQSSPLISTFPVGYFEVSRVLLKTGVLRILIWLPLGAASFVAAGYALKVAAADAINVAVTLAFVTLAAQPLMVMAKFSFGTNDSHRKAFFNVVMMLVMSVGSLVALIAAFGAFVGVFSSDERLAQATAVGIEFSAAWFVWRCYGYFFEKRAVDQLASLQTNPWG